MSAHSEDQRRRGGFGGFFFSLLLSFFPPLVQKLPPSSLVFQRGSSDVTSDGGAAAVRPESCIPAAQDCFRWGRATSLYLDLTEGKKNRQRADRQFVCKLCKVHDCEQKALR